jgi:protein-S-isoprenylcysteine O-methyltransferase Ste14
LCLLAPNVPGWLCPCCWQGISDMEASVLRLRWNNVLEHSHFPHGPQYDRLVPVGYIVLGVLGFVIAPLFEVFSLKRVPGLKQCVGALTVGLILYATIRVCMSSDRLDLPPWLSYVGCVVLGVALVLLVHSLFLSLPLRQTYVESGVGDTLVRTGAYALVRHPGVLWYLLLLVSLVLVFKARLLLIAAPVWLLMDVLYVTIQDKFLFGRMFAEYDNYRCETPMLIPTRKSAGACLRSLRPRDPSEAV